MARSIPGCPQQNTGTFPIHMVTISTDAHRVCPQPGSGIIIIINTLFYSDSSRSFVGTIVFWLRNPVIQTRFNDCNRIIMGLVNEFGLT